MFLAMRKRIANAWLEEAHQSIQNLFENSLTDLSKNNFNT